MPTHPTLETARFKGSEPAGAGRGSVLHGPKLRLTTNKIDSVLAPCSGFPWRGKNRGVRSESLERVAVNQASRGDISSGL
jgi:hypothetical protein